MAEGKGRYLPTKAEAIATVRDLKARNVRNIDVGCMQINLRYHPAAFNNLDQAFDPVANVAYGSTFLKSLFEETGSWQKASGRYHSATPEHNRPYRMRILKLWNEQTRLAHAARRAGPETPSGRAARRPLDRRRESGPDRTTFRSAPCPFGALRAPPPATPAGRRHSRSSVSAAPDGKVRRRRRVGRTRDDEEGPDRIRGLTAHHPACTYGALKRLRIIRHAVRAPRFRRSDVGRFHRGGASGSTADAGRDPRRARVFRGGQASDRGGRDRRHRPADGTGKPTERRGGHAGSRDHRPRRGVFPRRKRLERRPRPWRRSEFSILPRGTPIGMALAWAPRISRR